VSDIEVITFRPDPGQYAWTFGGAAPAMRIRPPAVLKVFTEDCFASSRSSDPSAAPCRAASHVPWLVSRWHNVNHARIRGNVIQLE
jgi:hypothetical protein